MGVIGRRRRPRWLLLGATLTFVVLALNAIIASRSSEPGQRVASLSFLDRVRGQIDESNRLGADLLDVRSQAAELGRDRIVRRLERVVRDGKAARDAVRGTDAPDHMAEAQSLLVTTLHLRAEASDRVKEALGKALASDGPGDAADLLADAGSDLLAADRSYVAFLEAVDRLPLADEAVLPASQWIEEPDAWHAAPLAAFVRALRSSTATAPVRDVTVVMVTTEPAPLRSEEGVEVLPVARTLRLHAVVANVGNEPVKDLKVEATLVPGGARSTVRDFVSLSPGQRLTVTLGGLEPIPGEVSTLTVRIDPPEGEATPADNEHSASIVMR